MMYLDDNALYRYYILLIVYAYILADGIFSQGILSTTEGRRTTAMAEPLYTWKESIIIPFVTVETCHYLRRLHNKVNNTWRWIEHK
jgi:hypothetical protein